jgi:type IV secretory pathway VirB10-like protein
MDKAERERNALLGKAAQADQLAADAAREREALERERRRLAEEEARRRADEDARRQQEEEERARADKEREAELARLRKEKFDMLQAQRAADVEKKAREEEAERLRKELEDLRRMQAERDKALKVGLTSSLFVVAKVLHIRIWLIRRRSASATRRLGLRRIGSARRQSGRVARLSETPPTWTRSKRRAGPRWSASATRPTAS